MYYRVKDYYLPDYVIIEAYDKLNENGFNLIFKELQYNPNWNEDCSIILDCSKIDFLQTEIENLSIFITALNAMPGNGINCLVVDANTDLNTIEYLESVAAKKTERKIKIFSAAADAIKWLEEKNSLLAIVKKELNEL